MSFNRLKYDNCEVKNYNQQSTGPGNYLYDTPIMCDNCLNDNPRIINQKKGVSINSNVDWRFYYGPVDVESELFNLNRPSSNCPSKSYIPNCDPKSCTNQGEICGTGGLESCNDLNDPNNPLRNSWNRPGDNNLVNFKNCFFPTEDTRLSNPSTNLRGTGWNRFNPLCKNPQEQVTFGGQYMTSTRLVFRDNHRPSVVEPNINNMNPNEEMRESPKINSVSGNFTNSLYQHGVCG
jgi:hypothetical protein